MAIKSKAVCCFAVLFMLLCAERAAACRCFAGGTPCEAYGRSSAVFLGTVLSKEERKVEPRRREREGENRGEYVPPVTYRFAVQESFGGIEGGEVEVVTGMGGGDCGYRFVQGAQYVVYAHRDPRSGRLSTSICSRTRPVADASEDLVFLRGLTNRTLGVTLQGGVHKADYSGSAEKPPFDKRLAGLPLVVEGEGLRRELKTDAEGRYQLAGLKAGTYTVKVTLPDELFTYRAEEKVTITERGCGNASFFVADNGRISGKVLDSEGQPVPKIVLEVRRAEEADAERRTYHNFVSTDEEGNFVIQPLKPGGYIIGVRLDGISFPDAVSNRYPRVFYPGVSELADATPITVGRAGEHVTERVLRLPPRLTERSIEGTVVLADGRPAENANVGYQELSASGNSSSYGAQTDARGRFTVKVYDGFTYLISAHINTGKNGGQMHAEPIEVTAVAEMQPIKLTISEPNGSCERCRNLRFRKKPTQP